MMSDDLTEAMEVWREAIDAASDSSIKFKTRADQAAARVIATALEARDAENSMLAAGACIYPNGDGLFGDGHGNSYCGVERTRRALDEEVTNLMAALAERDARIAELKEALEEARRAIGDHFAPNDCYATGPLTGDPHRDLVVCPACSFIATHDAILTKQEPK